MTLKVSVLYACLQKLKGQSPIETKIAKEAIEFGKKIRVIVIWEEISAIRRIIESLRKESKSTSKLSILS